MPSCRANQELLKLLEDAVDAEGAGRGLYFSYTYDLTLTTQARGGHVRGRRARKGGPQRSAGDERLRFPRPGWHEGLSVHASSHEPLVGSSSLPVAPRARRAPRSASSRCGSRTRRRGRSSCRCSAPPPPTFGTAPSPRRSSTPAPPGACVRAWPPARAGCGAHAGGARGTPRRSLVCARAASCMAGARGTWGAREQQRRRQERACGLPGDLRGAGQSWLRREPTGRGPPAALQCLRLPLHTLQRTQALSRLCLLRLAASGRTPRRAQSPATGRVRCERTRAPPPSSLPP